MEALGGEVWWLVRSVWPSNPPSGMQNLFVATRWQDAFLLGANNTFIADVHLWQWCYSQTLHSQWPQPPLLPAYLLRFPVALSLARLHMGKGTARSCLKALQHLQVVGLTYLRLQDWAVFMQESLSHAHCSGIFLQDFQGFGSLLGWW